MLNLPNKKHARSSTDDGKPPSPYTTPSELAERWRCSRSTIDRVARRAGFTRIYLGEGRNGIVRYLREEIDAYEASRTVTPGATPFSQDRKSRPG
jgi:predicted DNA-binding transcriptional regulator AlpA